MDSLVKEIQYQQNSSYYVLFLLDRMFVELVPGYSFHWTQSLLLFHYYPQLLLLKVNSFIWKKKYDFFRLQLSISLFCRFLVLLFTCSIQSRKGTLCSSNPASCTNRVIYRDLSNFQPLIIER